MIHRRVGSCQTTLGSRLRARTWPSTGLPSYRVKVRPRSLLQAIACTQGFAGSPKPPVV